MIKLKTETKVAMVGKLKTYFEAELDQEIGDFDAEFLLDFFAKEIGFQYYNQGLFDAQQALISRLDSINESIDELFVD